MINYTECALVNCADPEGGQIAVTINATDKKFTVAKGEAFDKWLNDPTMSTEMSIGELNRAHLHKRLDKFLDGSETI